MKKLIEPQKDEISEFYCDGCNSLVLITGLPIDQVPETHKKFSVAIQVDLCENGITAGLFADLNLCDDCGHKLIPVVERLFNIKITSPEFTKGMP